MSFFTQQDQGIDRESAAGWDPRRHQAQQSHRKDYTGQYDRIAGTCLVDDESQDTTGQNTEEQARR